MTTVRLRRRSVCGAVVVLAAAAGMSDRSSSRLAAHTAAPTAAGASSCGSAAFLTYEQGKLAAVDWVERSGGRVHTRAIETQSRVVDVTIDLRADETAAHSSALV